MISSFADYTREKLEAWLAKRGKTPSRYRHMMCFGAHGHGHSHGESHVSSSNTGHVKQRSAKQDVMRASFKDDDVACSLFTVDT